MSFLSNLLQQMPNAPRQQQQGPTLGDVFNSTVILQNLTPDAERELMQHLPEIDRTPHGLRAFLRSPQFQQALRAFNVAVVQGHMPAILRQMGIDPNQSVAADSATASFLKTLEKHLKKK